MAERTRKPKKSAEVEQVQEERFSAAEQTAKAAAMLEALRHLDPHADDAQQGYHEIARRLHEATGRELAANAAPST